MSAKTRSRIVILTRTYKNRDGYYAPGDSLELPSDEAQWLIGLGAARGPEIVPVPRGATPEDDQGNSENAGR